MSLFWVFFFQHQFWLMDIYWLLRDMKSVRVSKTLLSILAILNSAVVGGSLRYFLWSPLSSIYFPGFSELIPRAPTITGMTVIFHRFFSVVIILLLFTRQSENDSCYNNRICWYWCFYLWLPKWLSSKEMDMATRVQNLDETNCTSYSTNTLGKGMNPIILPG